VSLRVRFLKALLASLFGWIAGLLAAMPFQVLEAIRVAASDSHLLMSALGFTLTLWSILTFAVALYFCGFFLLSMAWMLPVSLILRHRGLWISTSTVFGILIMAARAHVWTALDHDGVSLINFWMWAVFSAAFCLVTSTCYAKFLPDVPVAA
jgi:hypothetical protein